MSKYNGFSNLELDVLLNAINDYGSVSLTIRKIRKEIKDEIKERTTQTQESHS